MPSSAYLSTAADPDQWTCGIGRNEARVMHSHGHFKGATFNPKLIIFSTVVLYIYILRES